jgi:Fic family protein
MTSFDPSIAYNSLPLLPPKRDKIETLEILRQESRAATMLAELKGLSRLLPNPAILINALVLKEAKASSEIENIITTDDELYRAITVREGNIDKATKEVLRYKQALTTGHRFILEKGFLSINGILLIQETLEENRAGIRRLPGTCLRNDRTNQIIYTPPDDSNAINTLMHNLETYLNVLDKEDVSPLIKLAVQHYQFESIHPFYDGNGRTGRIINVLYLLLHNLLTDPILYLSDYITEHKADYYRLLQAVRTDDDWASWILYMLKAVEDTARQTISRVVAIQTLFESTVAIARKAAPQVYSKELIELLFEYPYSKIEYVVNRLDVDRRTASKYLRKLEEIGILRTERHWKEALFINTALFKLLRQ